MKLAIWNHNFAASPNWKDKLAVSPIKHRNQESAEFFRMEQKRFMLVWDRNFRLPICSEELLEYYKILLTSENIANNSLNWIATLTKVVGDDNEDNCAEEDVDVLNKL